MEYLAIVLLSCLVGACSVNQKTEALHGDMPFVEGTPTKTLLQEMPELVNMPTDGEGNPVNPAVAAILPTPANFKKPLLFILCLAISVPPLLN